MKSVSVCPPAYYADLACERGRCYMARFLAGRTSEITQSAADQQALRSAFGALSDGIKDTMFYL